MSGRLVLVFGPSGAGKDTLLDAAAVRLTGHPGLCFARRIITRTAQAGGEQNETVDEAGFLALSEAGAFALEWRAHGFAYAIPAGILDHLAANRTVVANVSRTVLAQAAGRFPMHLLEITASPGLRAVRLGARAREYTPVIAARLARDPPVEPRLARITIRNDGTVEEGVAALCDSLLAVAGPFPCGAEP